MLADNALLLVVLLFLAAAGGAWTARRVGRHSARKPSPKKNVNPEYFRGVTYLLNEQPDKAIEVFVRMAEVDNETVETHFALGSLFRRRGEVDRAIRIHQNIIARPNLDKKQRDQALFALASDYLKAGLFDRAEKLFLQLTAVTGQRQAAMKRLVRIYEQQKDWAQAIEVRRKLGAAQFGNDDGGVAHAYCELAQAALQKSDYNGARGFLRKARTSGRELVRSAYMRAQVAEHQNDHRAVIKLCRWIIENDASFAVEILPLLLRALRASGGEAMVEKTLHTMLNKNDSLQPALGVAALTHNELDNQVMLSAVQSVIEQTPFAQRLAAAITVRPSIESTEDATFDAAITGASLIELDKLAVSRIAPVLRELIQGRAKYECRECGYSGNVLYWQCPGCKNWDSTRPVMSLLGGTSHHFV